jgi:hypothetical protein
VKKEEILAKVQAGEMSIEEATKLLADSAPKRGQLYCKVSEKGAISVYGLQRMPVTLYVEQWERLLGFADEVKSFMQENASRLKRKDAAGAE